MNDPLASALSKIMNSEKVGRMTVTIKPVSKLLIGVLEIMKANTYIGDYKVVNDGRGGYLELSLIGRINQCGAIKPRFSVTMQKYDKFEKSFLPAKDFGMLIVSTPNGLSTHIEAKGKGVGGKLIAYCY